MASTYPSGDVSVENNGKESIQKHLKALFLQAQSLKLPVDFPVAKGAKIEYAFSEAKKVLDIQQRINKTFANSKYSVPSFILSVFAVLLVRYTSEENFIIGVNSQELQDVLVFVEANTSDPSSTSNVFSSFLDKICKSLQLGKQNREIQNKESLETLVPQYQQFVTTSFSFGNNYDDDDALNENKEISQPFSLSPTELHIHYNEKENSIQLVFRKGIFSEARIQEMLNQLIWLIDLTLEEPNSNIFDYSLVTKTTTSLPDPTQAMSKKWEGSIVSFLEKYAKDTPEKIVVTDKFESISYKQFNEVSNRLARELIEMGLKRQDVVAIFGHRSTPITLAIAAVLKAGAAFTIIDPVYPPQRIIDCLKVATPSGIITIEAIGKLPQEVRRYIKKNEPVDDEEEGTTSNSTPHIHFVYSIPSITSIVKNEILQHQSPENLHDISIGPDDIAVVTFTSGSTGMPKGVLGRHGPLTHYYPWMKETFQLSSTERISMQSGISHDPLQRDIFTPWFLGATTYVPDAEDIVNPGRLAQWFQTNKITVTHLTPAMGQLLTSILPDENGGEGKRVLLPDLRYAFFVGDVLTKKFVSSMCTHAPNCRVINLYGSTETQRSVSYFLVPRPDENDGKEFEKLKDIIPVGKGMKGVNALVLSRFTCQNQYQLAGIGELGEIFMQSPHLSKGYKGKAQETNEKFIINPFLKDTDESDRMYRTGDIGRFLPSGDVECLGRADDQVKIRGFRIELGEVNTALNCHEFVKECVTIVRKDLVANSDEKRIVSYVVFDMGNKEVRDANKESGEKTESVENHDNSTTDGDDDNIEQLSHFNTLIRLLRKYLRSKLPDYMIPAAIVALPRLPLTPNKKIKKESLPKPSSTIPDEDFVDARTDLEKELRIIWSEVLGTEMIGVHDNFFDLGGHSISATTLTFKIRQRLQGAESLPVELLYRAPTIGAMAVAIERLRSGKKTTQTATKVVDLSADTILDLSIMPETLKKHEEGAFDYNPIWSNPKIILLTGCTGFLGAFLLSDLLKHTNAKIYCLVRASNPEEGFRRIQNSLFSHKLIWNPEKPTKMDLAVDLKKFEKYLQDRTQAVLGDLAKPLLGLEKKEFDGLCESIDVIVHNGALVHWMYPYEKLKATNVNGTVEILRMACKGKKLKPVHYISTTSVFDSDRYSNLSDVFENSDLPFHEDLRGGYPQSKYVAERLVMNARKRGLPTCVYRPGYITGHSQTGVWNPDDYLCRMIKGCIQMQIYPDFPNTKLDLSPVDFVSRAIVYLMLKKDSLVKHKAYHIVNPNEFKFNELFDTAEKLGYNVKPMENVDKWKETLFTAVLKKQESGEEENALYPMLTYFSDDFGARMRTAKRPWFDNSNTLEGMKSSGIECPSVIKLMGTYYRFLCQCGFLSAPKEPTELAIQMGFDLLSPREQPPEDAFWMCDEGKKSGGMKRSGSSSSLSSSSSMSSYKDLMRTRS